MLQIIPHTGLLCSLSHYGVITLPETAPPQQISLFSAEDSAAQHELELEPPQEGFNTF